MGRWCCCSAQFHIMSKLSSMSIAIIVTIASLTHCQVLDQLAFNSMVNVAICEAKCYEQQPRTETGKDFFASSCWTKDCDKCLRPLKNMKVTNVEDCVTQCGYDLPCRETCHCQFNEKTSPEMLLNGSSNHGSNFTLSLSKPDLVCRDVPYDKSSATVILEWQGIVNKSNQTLTDLWMPSIPIVYIIQKRDRNMERNGTWEFLGKGVTTLYRMTGLEFDDEYQFRVTAVTSDGIQEPEVESDWIQTLAEDIRLLPPQNIRILEMFASPPNETGIDAVVIWDLPPQRICSYKYYCYSSDDRMRQDIIAVYDLEFPIYLKNLKYDTNYTIDIMSTIENGRKESTKSVAYFTTPSCLSVRNNNFNICNPNPPENVHLVVANGLLQVEVIWKKPKFTSPSNPVLSYTVTLWKRLNYLEGDRIRPLQRQLTLPATQTVAILRDLHPDNSYVVSVYSTSYGGNSSAVYQSFDLPILNKNKSSEVSHYIAGSCVSLFIIVIMAYIICWHRKKSKEKKRRKKYFDSLEQRTPLADCELSIATLPEPPSPGYNHFEVDFSCFVLGDKLGQGAFGIVHKARLNLPSADPLTTQRTVAVKMLKGRTEDDRLQLLQEIEILKNLGHHAHIVNLIACSTKGPTICLAVEHCPLGDLQTYLRKLREQFLDAVESPLHQLDSGLGQNSNGQRVQYADVQLPNSYEVSVPVYRNLHQYVNGEVYVQDPTEPNGFATISPSDLLSYARQITMGMEYLSSNKFVHRDLATRNVLLMDKTLVKLSDFGLSRDISERSVYHKTTTGKLPLKWMALESISHQFYTIKSDVWAFGIVLWEIITLGGTPYPGIGCSELLDLLKTGYRMQKPDNCSEEIYQIMKSCWKLNPTTRPSFTELRTKLETILEYTAQYMTFDLEGNTDYYMQQDSTTELHKKGLSTTDEQNDSAFVEKRDNISIHSSDQHTTDFHVSTENEENLDRNQRLNC